MGLKKMEVNKIHLVSIEYPPYGGGAGIYARDLLKVFKAKEIIFNMLTKDFIFNLNSTTPKRRNRNNLLCWISFIFSFFRCLLSRKSEKEVLILNDFFLSIMMAFLPTFFYRNQVGMLHGSEPENVMVGNCLRKLLYEHYLRKANVLIAVSRDLKEKFMEFFPNIPNLEKKIHVIHSGIELNVFHVGAEVERKKFVLLSVSRIVKKKGYIEAIQICEKLKESNINFEWRIAGDGPDLFDLKRIISNSSIKEDVIFLGRIERDSLVSEYQNATVFLLLSHFRESFGLVYLEAIACGCFCIANNLGGVVEVINHNVSGICIEKGDVDHAVKKIFELNSQRPNRKFVSEAAKQFDFRVYTQNFWTLITGL